MQLYKQELVKVGFAYFLILLGMALLIHDIPNQLDPFITIHQLIEMSPFGDPKYFATAAIEISEKGWVTSANDWVFNLWPPGFVLMEASILKIVGPDAPVIFILQTLAVLLFTVVLVLLYAFLREHMTSKFTFLLPLLIFAFPVSRAFLLQPIGIIFGESFSVGFFLLGILLTLRSMTQKSLYYPLFAGLFLALAAYFRSQYEIILLAATIWGVILVFICKIPSFRSLVDSVVLKSTTKTIAVVLLAAHVATLPWRIYHWIYQGAISWVYTSNLTFEASVRTSEVLRAGHGGFIVEGGGNLVCRINPMVCGDLVNAKKLFITTFLENSFEWYSIKLNLIGRYWFSSVQNWSPVSVPSTTLDLIINGILLAALISLLVLLFFRAVRSHDSWILLFWFSASLFSAYFLIFSLVHFEVRYFYFPKIVGLVMFLIVLSMYLRQSRKAVLGDTY